ncbi:MAG: SAM domain-containing protein [Rhizobium sp.]|uniref:SAM domain-containing protein n=1 Tax=Rhizobium sp. TaxID=391 RepID=UPI00389AAD5D
MLPQCQPGMAVALDDVIELTDADLQQLGMLLGHRKRLLKAIKMLRIPTSNRGSGPEEPGGQSRAAEIVAERRRLTVMSVDLVGSTALAVAP